MRQERIAELHFFAGNGPMEGIDDAAMEKKCAAQLFLARLQNLDLPKRTST
jgi:hypothetical protein